MGGQVTDPGEQRRSSSGYGIDRASVVAEEKEQRQWLAHQE